MIAAVLLDAAPYISALVRHDQPGDTRAKLRFFKGLLHCHGIGLLHRHQCDQNQVFPLQATPGIGQLAEANSDHRETLHRADLNRVIDEIRPVVGLFQWPQQRIKSQPHQPTPHCRPSHHGGGNRATTKKAEHHLQRLRSRTERQLDPGHQLDRQCNTPNRPVATHRTRCCRPPGWYRYGNLLAALGRGGVRRDRLPQDLWLADWFAVDCPREIDSRRAFRRHVDWTGPRAADSLSGAVSQSVHYPFFSAPSRAANRARNSADSTSRCSDCSRSCRSWDSRLARAA